MDDGWQPRWECPACGLPYDELPFGHCLATPADGSPATCAIVTADPGIIDRWLGR